MVQGGYWEGFSTANACAYHSVGYAFDAPQDLTSASIDITYLANNQQGSVFIALVDTQNRYVPQRSHRRLRLSPRR